MKKICIFLIFVLLTSLAYADVWNAYTAIDYTGVYTRFVGKGGQVHYYVTASDTDKRTNSQNQVFYEQDAFDFSNTQLNWNVNIPNLSNQTENVNNNIVEYNAYVSNDTPCGDYTSTITIDDIGNLIANDTGSRNDTSVNVSLTSTVIDLDILCSSNATYAYNNAEYPLVITSLNDDDDNNNGIKDNTETNVTGENDLVPITVNVYPYNSSTQNYCKIKFTLSNVNLFANANKTNPISNNTEYRVRNLSNGTVTVYAETVETRTGSINVSLITDYTEPENSHFSANNTVIQKTVYIATSSVNVSEVNGNDNTEIISPGMIVGKCDDLFNSSKQLSLTYNVNSNITDYSITISKNNNNAKLYYTSYVNNLPVQNEITSDITFNKNEIPAYLVVKGNEFGNTTVTASLNIKAINGTANNITDFHKDQLLITTVGVNLSSAGVNDSNENIDPGLVLGLNYSNVIDVNYNNISDINNNSAYAGYKISFSIPSNLDIYTDEDLTQTLQSQYVIGTNIVPTHLYVYGKSANTQTLSVNILPPNTAGINYNTIHTDSMKVSVIYCDLSIDSNNDGTLNQTLNGNDDSVEETSPGMYIPCNTDDDDNDGIEDKSDDYVSAQINNTGLPPGLPPGVGGTSGDNEIKQLKLISYIFYSNPNNNPYTGYYAKLTYSDNIKLYNSQSKSTQINGTNTSGYVPSNTVYTVGTNTPPNTLYIEGISNGAGEINFTIYNTDNEEVYNDKVVFTVEPIIDTVEFLSPDLNAQIGGIVPVRIKRTQRYSHSTGVLYVKETDSHINDTDHPATVWYQFPTTGMTDNLVIESTTQNTENRTTETIYRYKWNTVTTPMPNYGNMVQGGQTHNGEHTLVYELTIGALPKVDTNHTVNLKNLTISANNDILVWKGLDENNNIIESPTINLTVNDNDTNDPYTVTVNIYHTGAEYSGTVNNYGQSLWQPVKTITLTNCTGNSQTITWDGSLNSGINSQSALSHDNWTDTYNELVEANNGSPSGITVPAPTVAEPWTYTYDITVTQNDTETYTFPNSQNPVTWSQSDSAHLRSDYLSIQRAKDENNKYIYDMDFLNICSENNSNHRYLYKDFILKDSLNLNAQSLTIQLYDFTDNYPIYTVNPTYCEKHSENDLKSSSNIAHSTILEIPKECITTNDAMSSPLIAEDNHGLKYRNHNTKNCIALNQAKEKKQALWLIEIPDKLPYYGEEYEINISARDINDISHIYENAKENFKIEVESSRYAGVCGNKSESYMTGENSATNILSKDFQVIGLKTNNIDYESITDDLRDSSVSNKWTKYVSGYKNGIISLKLKSYDYGGNAKIKIIPQRDNDLVVYTNSLDNELQNIINNYYNYDYLLSSNIHYILQRNNDNKIAYCPWDFDNDEMPDSWELTEYNSEANYEKNISLSDYEKLYSISTNTDNEISLFRKNRIANIKLCNPSLNNIQEEKKDNISAICEYRGVILKNGLFIRLSPYKQEFFFSIERPNNQFWDDFRQNYKKFYNGYELSDYEVSIINSSICSSNDIISYFNND